MDIRQTFLPVAEELMTSFPTHVVYIRNLGAMYDPVTGEVLEHRAVHHQGWRAFLGGASRPAVLVRITSCGSGSTTAPAACLSCPRLEMSLSTTTPAGRS